MTDHYTLAPVRVVARAYGKVNLHLGVGPRRDDGFHDLESVFQAVSAAETITLFAPGTLSRGHVVIGVDVEGDVRLDGVPRDHSNLAVAAVERVAEAYRTIVRSVGADGTTHSGTETASSGNAPSATSADSGMGGNSGARGVGCMNVATTTHSLALPEVRVHIHKTIPVQGGMAGGSADCAAALVAADYLYRTYCAEALGRPEIVLSKEQLSAIGADLGSDVPFCILGGTALGAGRGEKLTPLATQGTYWWVFALSYQSLSTPLAFRTLDARRDEGRATEPIGNSAELQNALRRGDSAAVGQLLANDLDPIAREITRARAAESPTDTSVAGGGAHEGGSENAGEIPAAADARGEDESDEPGTMTSDIDAVFHIVEQGTEWWRGGEKCATELSAENRMAGESGEESTARAAGAKANGEDVPSQAVGTGAQSAADQPVVFGGIVSGSGPTCAFLVESEEDAQKLAALLDNSGVCSGVVIAQGPAHGAHVIEATTCADS